MTNRWWPLDNINNMWEVLSNLINIFYMFVTQTYYFVIICYTKENKKKRNKSN